MATKRKPSAVRKNEGSFRPDRHGTPIEVAELPDDTPPVTLKGNKAAQAAYRELFGQIKAVLGTVSTSDVATIEIMASTLARIRNVRDRIEKTPEFVECPKTGETVPNVRLETLEKTMASLASRFAADRKCFGIDPAARAVFESANRPALEQSDPMAFMAGRGQT